MSTGIRNPYINYIVTISFIIIVWIDVFLSDQMEFTETVIY